MRKISKITIHCSDSSFGDVAIIRKWHKDRGWQDIGYHYVILNGKTSKNNIEPYLNGQIQIGRDLKLIPASVYGHNDNQIAICLIGEPKELFTMEQIKSLVKLVVGLVKRFDIKIEDIRGHRELDPKKECPCFNVMLIRQLVKIAIKEKI